MTNIVVQVEWRCDILIPRTCKCDYLQVRLSVWRYWIAQVDLAILMEKHKENLIHRKRGDNVTPETEIGQMHL